MLCTMYNKYVIQITTNFIRISCFSYEINFEFLKVIYLWVLTKFLGFFYNLQAAQVFSYCYQYTVKV